MFSAILWATLAKFSDIVYNRQKTIKRKITRCLTLVDLTNKFNPQVGKIAVSLIRQFDERVSSIPNILKLTLGET